MLSICRKPRWSPYLVGAGIGVLSWATFYFMGKALGTSTSFVGAAGAIAGAVAPEHVAANAYFVKEYGAKAGATGFKPVFDWQMALDFALVAGAFLAAWLGGTFRTERVPSVWAERFGPSVAKRYATAFAGGFILLFGARMAGGCTSGHGISGGLQLAVSSWTFFVSMFASGVVVAAILFGLAPGRSGGGKEVTRV
ncbi:MAG: YeeE/YedE family protein [Phycisphaerales bacterium]|nr:YeeE/YedE family protein [Phycisphaerales bacterium]MCB9868127.1 YeeE/YedE family protein [Phycisphaerales bacterium]